MRKPLRLVCITLLLVVTPACTRETPPPVADTTAAAPATTLPPSRDSLVSGAAAGTLALRSEAQAHFDRTQDARARQDAKAMATELRAAARLFRGYSDSVAGELGGQIVETSRELENAAREADSGRVPAADLLIRTFARANRVEAERHHAKATKAWAAHDTVRSGEELLMAIDHLERAAKDAGVTLDSAQRAELDRGRTLGASMLNRSPPAANEVDRSMAGIGTRITRMKARLARKES